MVDTTVKTEPVTRVQTPASGGLKEPLREGRIQLRIHGCDTVRPILLCRQALEMSGVARVLSLSPSRDGSVHMVVQLERPLRIATFFRSLPGLSWVDASWIQTMENTPMCDVSLKEAVLPREAHGTDQAFKDAVSAAIAGAQ